MAVCNQANVYNKSVCVCVCACVSTVCVWSVCVFIVYIGSTVEGPRM